MGVDNGVETRSDKDTKDVRGEHDDDFLPQMAQMGADGRGD